MDGRPLENYYRWLGLTYVVSLLTNPALSLPCGTDHAGMPFGLQLVGPFRGDRRVLDIAQALESALSQEDTLRRPKPDLHKLAASQAALKSIVTAAPDEALAQGGAAAQ
jgi:Asp-tRNA(Asn)/Glu-tRNA(Gln) amidotransferase A subunit family amidase